MVTPRLDRAEGRSGPDRALLAAWVAAVAVGLIALGLSIWRLMPGLGFWDTAEFQTVLPVMGTAHPTGYPSYVLIGWLASVLLQPLGEAALRTNVLSAILVAVGAAFTVDLARRLSGSVALGIAAGLGIAVTPIVWAVGTHADPHALHFALVAIILWLLVRWEHARLGNPMDPAAWELAEADSSAGEADEAEAAGATGADDDPGAGDDPAAAAVSGRRADRLLLAAAVVVGISVGNHSLTLLLGPPIVLYVLAVEPGILRRRRFILANIVAFAIPTVLIRFEMVLRGGWFRAPFVYADPSTFTGFWYVTLGAQFHGWLTDPFSNGPKRLADLVTIAVGQFGPLALVLLVAFVVTAVRQPRYALLSGTTMALTCFFNSVYPDGAIDRYYIGPALIGWTWLAILAATVVDAIVPHELTGPGAGSARRAAGADGAATSARSWSLAGLLRPIGLAALAIALLVPSALAFPGRAAVVDQTGNRAAQTWTAAVLGNVEPDAVIVSWWSYSTPLWYATIVDGQRPDICVIDDRNRLDYVLGDLDQVIDRYIATRPVYLVRNGTSELGALEGRYTLTPLPSAGLGTVLQVRATAEHGAPVTPPAGSSEPCR